MGLLIKQIVFEVFLEDRDERCVGNGWQKIVPDEDRCNAEDMVCNFVRGSTSLLDDDRNRF